MKDFDAVVFDKDGVIFDSERCGLVCWLEVGEKYGMEDIEKTFLACTGTNAEKNKQILKETYGESFPCEEFINEVFGSFEERYDGGRLPMKPGVFEILEFLRENGKKIALASSAGRNSVEKELKNAGIYGYFDAVISGDMVRKSKPEPDIFILACERIDVKPERAYAIEDSYNGIKAAYTGGLKPIMVPDMLPANEEMRGLAEAVIKDLTEVTDYLRN